MGGWSWPGEVGHGTRLIWSEDHPEEVLARWEVGPDVLFKFFLEAHPMRRPERADRILHVEVQRFEELVLRKEGIKASVEGEALFWVHERDAERVRELLEEWCPKILERVKRHSAGVGLVGAFAFGREPWGVRVIPEGWTRLRGAPSGRP